MMPKKMVGRTKGRKPGAAVRGGVPDRLPCHITSCQNEAENAVVKRVGVAHESKTVFVCRDHTSRYDQVLVGPGPA